MSAMKWIPAALLPIAATGMVALAPLAAHAKVYLSIEQAQKDLFGATPLKAMPVALTSAQQEQLKDVSSVSYPFQGNRIWKSADGGWLVVDEVVGKHEMITYAVAISPDGTVRRVEILEYRETYGYEVADDAWLKQFVGKTSGSPIKLGKDIQNVSGATLSSKHVTDGVKRVMALYALLLRSMG
jgi:Na+-translocating ferredoxin:NAD+ oxidoreductase RnfG subunit